MSGASSTWPGVQESELESEFEQELGAEGEGFLGDVVGGLLGEGEGEDFLGDVVGGLLGEGEMMAESEFEGEGESEGEGFLGDIAGGLLGEGELEGEQFFGNVFKKFAPFLKKIAKVAAPMVGTAILGPAGGMLGKFAANALGEGEFEGEFEFESELESEFELEGEGESEGEAEAESEISTHPASEYEALAEMMAEAASHASGAGEAEAMAGAAVVTVLSPRDRRALSSLLPDLLRGTAVLTRILRRHPRTRPLVRTVPNIMRRSVRLLKRRAAAGRPITRRAAARTTAREVRRILGSPRLVRASLIRNRRTSRTMRRSRGSYRRVAG
jgi:hypothetical protein